MKFKTFEALKGNQDYSKPESHSDEIEKPIRTVEDILNILRNGRETLSLNDAYELINAHKSSEVINNLEKFSEIDYSEIANKIMDQGIDISRNLKKFVYLNSNIADRLIEEGAISFVLEDIDRFTQLGKKTANMILSKIVGPSRFGTHNNFFRVNFYKFNGLDEEIAIKLTKMNNDIKLVSENLNSFSGLGQKMADIFIEYGYCSVVSKNLDKFADLSKETLDFIDKYSNNKDSNFVYKNRINFDLKNIFSNYELARVKSLKEIHYIWEMSEDSDGGQFKKLLELTDEDTLGKLWKDYDKNEFHIIGPQIIKMFQISKYSKDTFRGEFLERIIKDGAKYGEQQIESLRHFHQIVQSIYEQELETDISSVLTEAASFEHTKLIAEQLKNEGPFKNWETLKKYYELSEVIKQREVLEKLQKLKDEGKVKQYKFFTDLAFHPGSKIPMQTVFQFMEDPARFLDVIDVHASEAHERKKPSNYTKFPHLDISAEDLRDALIEGNLDNLQYFKPFEANYKIFDKDYSEEEIVLMLKDALGSFRDKIKGNAKNPGKLFQTTQAILKKHSIEYKDLIDNPSLINDELKNELERELFDKNVGITENRKFGEFLVKIHPKSAPEGHLAGNDTACCMPFGSGKNNVYMYNLGCSILTVQRKVGGKYRTIAQSVLTPDVDIKYKISDLKDQVQNETLLSNVITEDLSQKKKVILTADNIEVAPNNDKFKSVIEKIYTDFISKYTREINSDEVEKDRMLVGQGYSDLHFSNASTIDNTFIPITPVAYSDNYGTDVYELPLVEKSNLSQLPDYGILQKVENSSLYPDLPKGVSYLNAHDTLRVSYMEGKVYAENESLIQYIHRIGNELTAKDINNSFKNRPNLSLKIEDDKGAMLGYLIAYEGVESKNIVTDEKVIYISDLAADTSKSKIAGGKLIKAFEVLIKREYLEKNKPIPIIAEARESTSYKIIQKQLNDLGNQYGYKYELEENGSYQSGKDKMYNIKLIPIKI